MIKKERIDSNKEHVNAFLGGGTEFKGVLSFEGTVRIDGKLEGEVYTKDTLVIGEEAVVNAEISAGVVIISGKITGNVTAEKKIVICSTARLYGNIKTPLLSIDEGVIFEGSCEMGRKEKESKISLVEKKDVGEKDDQITSEKKILK